MNKGTNALCPGCMLPSGEQGICPVCGYDPEAGYDTNYYKPGSVLGSRYLVGKLARKNGEGALYIGYDRDVQSVVWIREYYPHTMARRDPVTGTVSPSGGYGAQYKAHMSDFVDICNEIKRLSVTEPVVPIENVVYENNTVYAVYRDLSLIPLEEYLAGRGGKIPLEEARELLSPLGNTLNYIHSHGQIHRGVSPYSVYVDPRGKLYLWDFALGATRTAGSELECELFDGYSAPEQYSPSGWQGTWTDVYAFAALLYRAVSGVTPPKADELSLARPMVPLEDLTMDASKAVSFAVSEAMLPSTDRRTQAILTFTSQLNQRDLPSTAVYDTNKITGYGGRKKKSARRRKGRQDKMGGKYVLFASMFTVVVLITFTLVFMNAYFPEFMGGNASASPHSSTSAPESGPDGAAPGESSPDTEVRTLPLFVGQMANDVTTNSKYVQDYDFFIKEEYSDTVESGLIFNQSPLEGTTMTNRGTVILYVSKGKEPVTMPLIVGMTLEEATDVLFNMELSFEKFDMYDSKAKPNTVVRTVPEAGVEFDPAKQKVYLFVMPEQAVIESSSRPSASSQEPGRIIIPSASDSGR